MQSPRKSECDQRSRSPHRFFGAYPRVCLWGLAHAVKTAHLLNRSGYRIANWFRAAYQCRQAMLASPRGQPQKFSEWRTRWMIQVCTLAFGKAASMASGKPFRPSTTAIHCPKGECQHSLKGRMSSSPRSLRLFVLESQNLAPLLAAIHRPRTSHLPSGATHRATQTALFLTCLLFASRILTRRASSKNDGINWFQSAVLPIRNLLQNRIGDTADQVGRNASSTDFLKMASVVAGGQACRIEPDSFVVHPVDPGLAFTDQFKLKTAFSVARAVHC